MSLKLTDIVQTMEAVEEENSRLPGPIKRQKVLDLLKNVWPSFNDQLAGEIIDLACDVSSGVYKIQKKHTRCCL